MVSLDIHHTSLSMNGIFLIMSNLSPFVLSSSKDSERVFQQPASLGLYTAQRAKLSYVALEKEA